MNDFMEAAGPVVLILITLVMYVFVVQLVNDPACASLEKVSAPIIGKGIIKVLMLCW